MLELIQCQYPKGLRAVVGRTCNGLQHVPQGDAQSDVAEYVMGDDPSEEPRGDLMDGFMKLFGGRGQKPGLRKRNAPSP